MPNLAFPSAFLYSDAALEWRPGDKRRPLPPRLQSVQNNGWHGASLLITALIPTSVMTALSVNQSNPQSCLLGALGVMALV